MASRPDDPADDPTRALDDFVRRMRPQPPAPPPDLDDIGRGLHATTPGVPSPPGVPVAPATASRGRLRNGLRRSAGDLDDVVDVPVVDLPHLPHPPATETGAPRVDLPDVEPPPAADADALAAALAAGLRDVRDAAAAQQADDPRPAWQPDPVALRLRSAVPPRLLLQWQPGAWVAAVRPLFDGHTEVVTSAQGPVVESFPAQRLLLLWPPRADSGPPGRWPHSAWLLDADAEPAAVDALRLLPDDARVWPRPDDGDIDWALGAELVLHHTAGLRPHQIDGLRAFIAAERERVFARLNDGYRQASPGGAVQQR